MVPIKIGLVGFGKIAQDQHMPTLRAGTAFELAGVASPQNHLAGVPHFRNVASLADGVPELAAVAICTPPQVRYAIAREALERGLHVLLEKPPGMTVGEVLALQALAERKAVALFASWHSRYAPAVALARAWIAQRQVSRVAVSWKEDVRVWHPGQEWIWNAGGLGVFDPGINALSILTFIMPSALVVNESHLIFPRNRAMPIRARLVLSDAADVPISMDLDFLQQGPQTWDIVVDSPAGTLKLAMGGRTMSIDGVAAVIDDVPEYRALYAHFAALVRARRSDVDLSPMRLVADAFLSGHRVEGPPFIE